METTTMDPIVDTAIFVYSDRYMKWMIPFRIVTALLGVVVLAVMMYHRKSVSQQKFVAHFNLSFLLSIHIIFNFFACLFVAIDDIYIMYQQQTWKTGDDLVLTGHECFVWRIPPCVALYGTMFSLTIISVERCLATIFYKHYEQCPKWLGAWFGLAEIIIPFIMASIITSYYDFEARFSYCSIVSKSNFEVVMSIGYIFLVLEFLAIIIFHICLFVNWRRMKRRATMDPTGRYQITENFRTIITVTPLIWCHFLIILGSASIFFFYNSFNPTFDPRVYPILEESSNLLYWHGVILPFIFFLLYRYSSKRDRRVLKDNGFGQRQPEVVIARHEKEITKGW